MPTFKAPDGARLFFQDVGDGVPIIALAGLSRNGSDFDYIAPYLTDNRLIRLDYRGRGKSEWTGADTYTIPIELGDVIALMDHLQLEKAGILGTSRGGLIAMGMAAAAKQRMLGACLVDTGPEIAQAGLDSIHDYLGRNPTQRTYVEAARVRAELIPGFDNVPPDRWQDEVRKHYLETEDGLVINYDPALRNAFLAASAAPLPDLWPVFDLLSGLPLALIRGANSELLTIETADEMSHRRPDMIRCDVPDRGHVPFLDEPEAVEVLKDWVACL